jgi:hypothetical protein
MNTDEIIAMLASIGVEPRAKRPTDWKGFVAVFERFAAMVAAKEREACAAVAADTFYGNPGELNHEIAAAIRARGQKEGA